MRVVVIDYGAGNLRSVVRALRYVGAASVEATADPRRVALADRLVFPGQGAMGSCMAGLRANGLGHALLSACRRVPTLGICMGLQVLFECSEEDEGTPGLGLLAGEVRRFRPPAGQRLKIPHMGWNQVTPALAHPLWHGIAPDAWFYFVHSFHVVPREPRIVAGVSEYGGIEFVAAVARERLFATQFHPEKSHDPGLRLLRNFLDWSGEG